MYTWSPGNDADDSPLKSMRTKWWSLVDWSQGRNRVDYRAQGATCGSAQPVGCVGMMAITVPRWRHQMETFSASLALCEGNPPVTGGFPSQRPVTRSFDVFFDVRLKNGWANTWDAGDIRRPVNFRRIFLNLHILLKISVICFQGSNNSITALFQIMAWCWTCAGDKLLSEPMLAAFTDAFMRYSVSITWSFWWESMYW